MWRRDQDEFDAPIEDITNDADAPQGRTEIGYQTEVIDRMDEEEMGMDDERAGIDEMAVAVGYLHDGGSEGRSGTQTELGYDSNEDRGDFEDEREERAAHMAREQAERGGGDGVLGYLHDGGSEGRSGSQTELGYLTEGFEGQSGQQTEIGGFLGKVKSWWHRLFSSTPKTHVGNEEIGTAVAATEAAVTAVTADTATAVVVVAGAAAPAGVAEGPTTTGPGSPTATRSTTGTRRISPTSYSR